MSKKQIRGLFDYLDLKDGEEWEWAPPSEDYVSGMGLGATKQAIRWAYNGYLLENMRAIKRINSRAVGRPKLAQHRNIDCRRALAIWQYVRINIPLELRPRASNRRLIHEMQKLQEAQKAASMKHDARLFPKESAALEASVSRGRKILEISEVWESKVCEKLFSI